MKHVFCCFSSNSNKFAYYGIWRIARFLRKNWDSYSNCSHVCWWHLVDTQRNCAWLETDMWYQALPRRSYQSVNQSLYFRQHGLRTRKPMDRRQTGEATRGRTRFHLYSSIVPYIASAAMTEDQVTVNYRQQWTKEFLPCDALRCTVFVIVILSVRLSVRPSVPWTIRTITGRFVLWCKTHKN